MRYRAFYMITDSQNNPLAHAVLQTKPEEPTWRVLVLDRKLESVLNCNTVNLIARNQENPDMKGKVISQGGENIALLEPVNSLDREICRNLRIPVRFDSFVYPVSKSWKGRYPVVCHDISCGGIAFFCVGALQIAEVVDVVISITKNPLILRTRVLRRSGSSAGISLYSAKFVDMIHDEEIMVREAVFSQQLRDQGSGKWA